MNFARDLIVLVDLAVAQLEERPSGPAEVVVEEKCKVCGHWLDARYYHGSCYTVVSGPALLPDMSGEIVIE